jgi:hypothetical protein
MPSLCLPGMPITAKGSHPLRGVSINYGFLVYPGEIEGTMAYYPLLAPFIQTPVRMRPIRRAVREKHQAKPVCELRAEG